MNWVLILWLLDIHGVTSQQINGLSRDGCKQEALRIMAPKHLSIVAVCVEKK